MPIFPGLIANSGGNLPGPPTNIGLSTASSSSLLATWTAPQYLGKHPLSTYIISLYNSSGGLINASYATAAFPATSLTITGLASGTFYSVRISLRNSINITSDLSVFSPNASTAVPTPPPTAPPVTPPPVTPPPVTPTPPPTPPPTKPPTTKPPTTKPPVRQCVPACPPGFFCLGGTCAG